MPASRESFHEKKANAAAKRAGWWNIKVRMRGWPDRLYGRQGAHVWVEWKAPGKRPRPQQGHRIKKLREAGEHVLVLDDWAVLAHELDRLSKSIGRDELSRTNALT